ncbi:OmpH family outer membrane protein [Oxalobacter aliiformigenes]|uniref:OmpH family outer membrane protein n=1 Tax=Oxalobacter aliiformigenes TaxID=2946593 RepID=A0ABY7JHL4_9BURK|nr:OmpH family outer membrane protein [Oxalobacter aliiformigenes]WAV95479.1 OmpH family outer membrane protein [Oxalobacter aliiformigenes]WAV96723.1 OmpH family outer membrane protein [Oxalobacter aliiformigenes]
MKNFAKTFLTARKAVVLAFCFCAFGLVHAQEYKIGYINPDRIMSESAPAKAAEKKLEGDFSKRNKELRDTQARLKSMGEKLDKDMPVLSESQRIKRQRELADLSQDFQRKQRAYREDFMQRRNEEIAKVFDRVNKEINKIAKDGKYDLIVQDAVYISPRVDITEQVLKALNN